MNTIELLHNAKGLIANAQASRTLSDDMQADHCRAVTRRFSAYIARGLYPTPEGTELDLNQQCVAHARELFNILQRIIGQSEERETLGTISDADYAAGLALMRKIQRVKL